jgi:hypothetical protein
LILAAEVAAPVHNALYIVARALLLCEHIVVEGHIGSDWAAWKSVIGLSTDRLFLRNGGISVPPELAVLGVPQVLFSV